MAGGREWRALRMGLSKRSIILGGAGIVLLSLVGVLATVLTVKPPDTVSIVPLPEGEYDPEVWGKQYPLQYKSYLKNRETAPSPTGFGGSINFQHAEKQPEILVNFKGMAFSKDYSEDRGHPYALEDLRESKRITPNSPGACMTCKSANLAGIYKEKGWKYANIPLSELLPKLKHSITCANCHDPSTMKLRIINPAFIEAMDRRNIDVRRATRDEMRSYVCAQCHVEYYFEPGTSKVVLPWDNGFQPEQIYGYYEGNPSGFEYDWIHPDSQAKMLKAQHPDYEMWTSGIHAKSGVSCADCHMPYMREKGKKYTSHWMTSPMKHPKESCATCHDRETADLLDRVKATQNNIWRLQQIAGKTVAGAHEAIRKAALSPAVNRAELDRARVMVRKAQWYWDFIAAENSMGFHSPVRTATILGQSIDLAYQATLAAVRATGRP